MIKGIILIMIGSIIYSIGIEALLGTGLYALVGCNVGVIFGLILTQWKE